ncbi:hypothetical protein [Mesorhizobium sp. SP-1A]|uniref:hypothetical protein n=1 Tax=Mesorhizobium sp. SP-1A TaxID=3077840 RepID=UPI0028F71AF7|nr:hypothetical protein [Mesorhizobium sp. SP-1A]
MITFAEAERTGDKELLRAVESAEKKFGFKTGVRFSEKGQHLVKVNFYPKTTFHIADTDANGIVSGEFRPLTREEFDSTHSIIL